MTAPTERTEASARELLTAIQAEALGRHMPTYRLARLIAGDRTALAEPCTRGKSIYSLMVQEAEQRLQRIIVAQLLADDITTSRAAELTGVSVAEIRRWLRAHVAAIPAAEVAR